MFNSEKTVNSHLAKVQLYRWYQLYEREINENRISNQMAILADDVIIKSAAGEMKGKDGYPARLTVYNEWQNAHHVKNITVKEVDDKILQLEAVIHYQNIQPDGQRKSYAINYNTQLIKTTKFLPVFSSIILEPTAELNEAFEDAYVINRVQSLMYYWLASMEQLDGNVLPFKEILTSDFVLNFSDGTNINTIEKFELWLNDIPRQLRQSSHHAEHFLVKKTLENEYEMAVEFDWYGITKDNKKMVARTQHTWEIVDNIDEPFAKIKKAVVNLINPFTIVD
jgi:hypothetical protein